MCSKRWNPWRSRQVWKVRWSGWGLILGAVGSPARQVLTGKVEARANWGLPSTVYPASLGLEEQCVLVQASGVTRWRRSLYGCTGQGCMDKMGAMRGGGSGFP